MRVKGCYYHRKTESAIPSINCFWVRKKITIMGRTLIAISVINTVQRPEYCGSLFDRFLLSRPALSGDQGAPFLHLVVQPLGVFREHQVIQRGHQESDRPEAAGQYQ